MPDLSSRSEHETALAAVLRDVLRQHGRRVTATGGMASPGQLESDLRRALAPMLLRVHLAAAEQLARQIGAQVDRDAVIREAQAWATETAAATATEITASSRDRAAEILLLFRDDEMSPAAFAQRMETIFGGQRAEDIAIGAVTDAISAGELVLAGLIVMDESEKPRPYWYTEADGRVCEVCGPLHGQPKEVWGRQFPSGPKAHRRCRCWLEWR